MGIYDRDYYRKSPKGAQQLVEWTQSAVGILIAINIVCYFAQFFGSNERGESSVTRFLAARPRDVFDGQVWKLLTANFAHSTANVWHIAGNMIFLFVLGRELEQIYGKRDFCILYLSAGVLAILAEVTSLQLTGQESTMVLGASGAVMAVAVLCALFYPNKVILIFFALPAPLWLVCVLFVLMDLMGAISGKTGVANLAHLTGALVGLLYRVFDLRWSHLRSLLRLPVRSRPARPRGEILEMPQRPRRPAPETGRDPVYQRVDELLAKITASGMDSLTGEELDFLRENSARFERRDR